MDLEGLFPAIERQHLMAEVEDMQVGTSFYCFYRCRSYPYDDDLVRLLDPEDFAIMSDAPYELFLLEGWLYNWHGIVSLERCFLILK